MAMLVLGSGIVPTLCFVSVVCNVFTAKHCKGMHSEAQN